VQGEERQEMSGVLRCVPTVLGVALRGVERGAGKGVGCIDVRDLIETEEDNSLNAEELAECVAYRCLNFLLHRKVEGDLDTKSDTHMTLTPTTDTHIHLHRKVEGDLDTKSDTHMTLTPTTDTHIHLHRKVEGDQAINRPGRRRNGNKCDPKIHRVPVAGLGLRGEGWRFEFSVGGMGYEVYGLWGVWGIEVYGLATSGMHE
jgi:hypothetical protein